jgi:hypothetical protein
MSGTSDFNQNRYIDSELRGQAFTLLSNVFVGLLKCTKGALARSTAYALNDTVAQVTSSGFLQLYRVTTAGTTAGSAPSFPGVAAEIITDGSAVLTEQSTVLESNTSMNEVSGGSYARATVACSLAAWAGTQGAGTTVASSGTSGQTSNNAAVTFAQATANWTTSPEAIWGFALYDASTSGNLIRFGGLTAVSSILNTNIASFAAGALVVKVDK